MKIENVFFSINSIIVNNVSKSNFMESEQLTENIQKRSNSFAGLRFHKKFTEEAEKEIYSSIIKKKEIF